METVKRSTIEVIMSDTDIQEAVRDFLAKKGYRGFADHVLEHNYGIDGSRRLHLTLSDPNVK